MKTDIWKYHGWLCVHCDNLSLLEKFIKWALENTFGFCTRQGRAMRIGMGLSLNPRHY